jgi:hypothetical protein
MRGKGLEHPEELRFVTYLSPGIPRAFFEAVVEYVRRALGYRTSLSWKRGSWDRSGTPAVLAKFGLECFAPVTYKHYASKSTHCEDASAQ